MGTVNKGTNKVISVKRKARVVELRIGPTSQGATRFADLSPAEAKEVAYHLLLNAERIIEQERREALKRQPR